MLWMYANRAGVPELEKTVAAGGTCRILDMGCGWGRWAARPLPFPGPENLSSPAPN